MKQITFSVDGNMLKGTLIFPENIQPKNPSVLFIQGWTGERKRSYQYANGLAELGYISFLLDARGHGESEGDINTATTKEFVDDVVAAYDYLSKIEGVDLENISVVGSSYGGYLAAVLSSKRNVKRIVLRAPGDLANNDFEKSAMQTIEKFSPNFLAWIGQSRKSHETFALDAIAEFNGEILIIESEKDTISPHQTVQNYADAVSDTSRLKHVVIKDAPHSVKDGPFKDEIEKVLKEWFKKNNN